MLWFVISNIRLLSPVVFAGVQPLIRAVPAWSCYLCPSTSTSTTSPVATLAAGLVNTGLVVSPSPSLSVLAINIAITMIVLAGETTQDSGAGQEWGLEVILDNKLESCDCDDVVTDTRPGMLRPDFLVRAITQILLQPGLRQIRSSDLTTSKEVALSGPGTGVTMPLPLYYTTDCLPAVEEFLIHKFWVRSYNFRLGGESN